MTVTAPGSAMAVGQAALGAINTPEILGNVSEIAAYLASDERIAFNEHGIFHFDQVAAWKKADIEAVEAYLAFDGRIAREDWIGQAKALARQGAAPATGKRGGRK